MNHPILELRIHCYFTKQYYAMKISQVFRILQDIQLLAFTKQTDFDTKGVKRSANNVISRFLLVAYKSGNAFDLVICPCFCDFYESRKKLYCSVKATTDIWLLFRLRQIGCAPKKRLFQTKYIYSEPCELSRNAILFQPLRGCLTLKRKNSNAPKTRKSCKIIFNLLSID